MQLNAGSWRARILCGFLAVLLSTGYPAISFSPALAQQAGQLTRKLIEQGITAYQEERYEEAASKLTQARVLAPTHSPTLLYLGLAHLRQGKTSEAIAAWQEYLTVTPDTAEERRSKLSQNLPQYLALLRREENQRLAQEAVARERQIGPGDANTVVITYYGNLVSPELTPLQKGLAALLIDDLSQVKDLTVVDRDRFQALLEELQLSATKPVDQQTVPKIGRLLGAGRVLRGSYLETAKGELQLDSVLVESTAAQVLGTHRTKGQLERFPALEKEAALGILKELGYDEQRLQTAGVLETLRRPHTTSLTALTAFSKGLDAKDRGAYGIARVQFQQALREDPNFALVKEELDTLPLVALTSGGIIAGVQASLPSASAATASLGAPATADTTAATSATETPSTT
ncbi:MAG: CsgG/HfaB family protein, partial [Candidatus Binatia bacterium]